MASHPCIILNPASGRGDGNLAAFEVARRRFPDVPVHKVPTPAKIKETVVEAIARGCDPIIAAGGDGTISAIAEAVAGSGARLGVVAMGTFNYFARSLGLPEDPGEALDVAINGADRPIAIGTVNDRVFLNNASLGAYASVLSVREDVYRNWGRSRIAAYWSVLKAMVTIYRSLTMRITVDGEVHHLRSPMAFVAIRAYQLQQFDLDGAEDVHSGKLALFVARDVGRFLLLWRAVRVFFRGARAGTDYVLLTGDEIEIETKRASRLVAHDGEKEKMTGPYRFRVLKNDLIVKVPRGKVDPS